MFGELRLKTFHAEVILEDFLVRATFQPRGSMLVYLNDKQRPFLPFENAEIQPLASDRQVGQVKQPLVVVNKRYLKILSLTEASEAAEEQLLASKRPVAFYTGHFAIQGQLHVNQDARNEDLLDETKDYFALSDVSIYPLRKVGTPPTRHVPMMFISRPLLQIYHVMEKKGE